ncbi:hypothetical protein E4U61_000201, partial [Claviceps capensis]
TAKLTTILRQIAGEGIEHSLGKPQFRHSSRLWIVLDGDLSVISWQRAEGDDTELEMKDEEPLERSAGKRSAIGVNRCDAQSNIIDNPAGERCKP